MAKYSKATQEVEDIVAEISSKLGLEQYGVDFQPLFVNKSKEVCKVVRANELAERVSNREDLVFVICNHDAFNGVTPEGHPYSDEKTKYLWIRTEMDKVSYDTEKCKVNIGCPMLSVPLGLWEKAKSDGKDTILLQNAALGQYTLANIEQDKKEEAERKKAEKRNKKKKKQQEE